MMFAAIVCVGVLAAVAVRGTCPEVGEAKKAIISAFEPCSCGEDQVEQPLGVKIRKFKPSAALRERCARLTSEDRPEATQERKRAESDCDLPALRAELTASLRNLTDAQKELLNFLSSASREERRAAVVAATAEVSTSRVAVEECEQAKIADVRAEFELLLQQKIDGAQVDLDELRAKVEAYKAQIKAAVDEARADLAEATTEFQARVTEFRAKIQAFKQLSAEERAERIQEIRDAVKAAADQLSLAAKDAADRTREQLVQVRAELRASTDAEKEAVRARLVALRGKVAEAVAALRERVREKVRALCLPQGASGNVEVGAENSVTLSTKEQCTARLGELRAAIKDGLKDNAARQQLRDLCENTADKVCAKLGELGEGLATVATKLADNGLCLTTSESSIDESEVDGEGAEVEVQVSLSFCRAIDADLEVAVEGEVSAENRKRMAAASDETTVRTVLTDEGFELEVEETSSAAALMASAAAAATFAVVAALA